MTRVPKELAESMIAKAKAINPPPMIKAVGEKIFTPSIQFAREQPRIRRAWSNAKPTTVRGIKFPSKLEAAWFEHLCGIVKATGARLYRQVKFPLLDIGAEETGIPRYFCVDFVMRGGTGDRVIDAKGRESRDWSRGKAAFEAEYGIQVEIMKGMPK
jgi:hypothetical protein